jgi:hypothetical protein
MSLDQAGPHDELQLRIGAMRAETDTGFRGFT